MNHPAGYRLGFIESPIRDCLLEFGREIQLLYQAAACRGMMPDDFTQTFGITFFQRVAPQAFGQAVNFAI